MTGRNLVWLIGVMAVGVFGLAVSRSAPSRGRDSDYEMARLMVDVLQEVRQRYVRELKPEEQRQLVEAMINGGLERLDPHSSYINPQEYKQFSRVSKGSFGGVGISLGVDMQKGSRLTVLSPIVGTPAYNAGVLAGDIITKINGKTTENIGISEAIDMIQGEPGTEVTLTVVHEGEKKPVDYTLKRDIIRVQSVIGDSRLPDGTPDFMLDKERKIAYIRISSFAETTVGELKAALATIQAAGARALVIDLRYNPGGLLSDHRGRKVVRQGKRAECDPDGKPVERAQAHHRQLLASQRQEHPPVPRQQGNRRVGREAFRGNGSEA